MTVDYGNRTRRQRANGYLGSGRRPRTVWWTVDVEWFRRFLDNNKMSLRTLSERSGVSLSTLSRACSERRITITNACAVAYVFGTRVSDVFGDDDSPDIRNLRYQIGTF